MRAIENLGIVWNDTGRFSSEEQMWSSFNEKYGTLAGLEGETPLGVEVENGKVGFSCLSCHADKVAGRVVTGVGNSMLDLGRLYDDLEQLRMVAERMGILVPEMQGTMNIETAAPGAYDAFGTSMRLSEQAAPIDIELNDFYGYQQARAWWTHKYKEKLYSDGSGETGGFRMMMSPSFGPGQSLQDLKALEDEYEHIFHYILDKEAPEWPFEKPSANRVEAGKEIYRNKCSSCHGIYRGANASFPNRVVKLDEIGTDPVRAEQFTENEASWINSSWFAENIQMTATDGYLAPMLVGVWATAPYFHNGSVPTLEGVLNSSARPDRWRRTGRGENDYDKQKVGWTYDVPDSSADSRDIYDTSVKGLDNGGHKYGDNLSSEQRANLIAYLKTL